MKFGEIWQKGYFGNFGRPDTKGILVILSRHRNKISRHSGGDLEQSCEIWQNGYFGNFGRPQQKGYFGNFGRLPRVENSTSRLFSTPCHVSKFQRSRKSNNKIIKNQKK